jgi:DNA polymerase
VTADRDALLEHLRFYAELGVDGVSRDAAWRLRPAAAAGEAAPSTATANAADTELRKGVGADDAATRGGFADASGDGMMPAEPGRSALVPGAGSAAGPGNSDPALVLQELRQHIGDCTRCKLHGLGRSQVVFGVGHPHARLMFVGEAPGQDEDIQGIPFVGRAGQLLTKMIEAIELKREQVYIANVIKCRPPQNRNPEPDEVATCEPFLFRQIDAIRPRVIVALGKFAAQALLRSNEPISRLRGRVFDYRGAVLVPTFHPAFLLRSPDYKREAWEDLKKVRALLAEG